MAVLGIIPARGGSKRIPGKNKKDFCGKPLINYIIKAALAASKLDTIVVNSNDKDILVLAASHDGIIPIERPSEISQDHSEAIDYVRHTLDILYKQGKTFDTIVILQPTSPFTLPEDIDNTIMLLEKSQANSCVSVMKLDHAIHPVKMKVMEGYKLNPFLEEERGRMAEHELPTIYVRNCSVYVTTLETIQSGKIIGDDCRGYVMPMERSVDINDPIDFDFAEFMYEKYHKEV